MLSQMNSVITTANSNIREGWKSSIVDGAGATAVGYAAGADLPAAGAFVLGALAGQGWNILKQVPSVVSGFYKAGKQAKQNLNLCGGG
jgi:UDP-N-acetylglucosamine enolpyruvyl transferase